MLEPILIHVCALQLSDLVLTSVLTAWAVEILQNRARFWPTLEASERLLNPLSRNCYCQSTTYLNRCQKCSTAYFGRNILYSGVFGVAKHKSEVILTEFKMADPSF